MRQVDPVIYSGIGPADRAHIAHELAQDKPRAAAALAEAKRLRATAFGPVASCVFRPQIVNRDALLLAGAFQAANRQPPLRLLACGVCHRPTPKCTCGVDWGIAL